MFRSTHPGERARRPRPYKSKSVYYGRNIDSDIHPRDSMFDRCKQCGFLVNRDRDVRQSRGEGRLSTAVNSIEAVAATPGVPIGLLLSLTGTSDAVEAVLDYYDPAVNSGCPFCGSYNF